MSNFMPKNEGDAPSSETSSMSSDLAEYTYDFQTSGFPIVDAIRAEIESQSEWDYSGTQDEVELNIFSAARRFGFFEPFDEEQVALNSILRRRNAGLHIATYAWGLYADALSTSEDIPANQAYA